MKSPEQNHNYDPNQQEYPRLIENVQESYENWYPTTDSNIPFSIRVSRGERSRSEMFGTYLQIDILNFATKESFMSGVHYWDDDSEVETINKKFNSSVKEVKGLRQDLYQNRQQPTQERLFIAVTTLMKDLGLAIHLINHPGSSAADQTAT